VAETRLRRRPQWRGERKAVLIRLPVDVAEKLAVVAEASSVSVSDAAGRLISDGLSHTKGDVA
jgi:hypothetical protein